jgi:hypothetical protein
VIADISDDEINVLMSDDTRKKYYGDNYTGDSEIGTKAAKARPSEALSGEPSEP